MDIKVGDIYATDEQHGVRLIAGVTELRNGFPYGWMVQVCGEGMYSTTMHTALSVGAANPLIPWRKLEPKSLVAPVAAVPEEVAAC